MLLAEKILAFLSHLQLTTALPDGVEALNPYRDRTTWHLCEQFYRKYYSDRRVRTIILGINPGRFGGGLTGIPFTDPVKLETECGIPNTLKRKAELSADFIYQMIGAYGGVEKFYQHFYIGSISPLGFTKDGKNLNYYDIRELEKSITPFIVDSLTSELSFVRREVCFCLGEGKNFKFLSELNAKHHFFKKIVPLSHPRFIMQYRRKQINTFIDDYLSKLNSGLT